MALSLAHYIKDAQVHTIVFPKAIAIARKMLRNLSLEEKVVFIMGIYCHQSRYFRWEGRY